MRFTYVTCLHAYLQNQTGLEMPGFGVEGVGGDDVVVDLPWYGIGGMLPESFDCQGLDYNVYPGLGKVRSGLEVRGGVDLSALRGFVSL